MLSGWLAAFALAACPQFDPKFVSQGGGRQAKLSVRSKFPGSVSVWWVNSDGREIAVGTSVEGEPFDTNTFHGHVFRAYSFPVKVFLAQHKVSRDRDTFEIVECGDVVERYEEVKAARDPNLLASLTVNKSCTGPSSTWSCVHVPTEWPQDQYGFQPNGVPQGRKLYQTKDDGYVSHRDDIIRYTNGPGFLIVRQPGQMHAELMEFLTRFRAEKKIEPHDKIPGNYMNDDFVKILKANLDSDWGFRFRILEYMTPVLEAWANSTLEHTSTYGIRIYQRGSMLLDHIDRHSTHIISAVVQVDQDCDEGWPLTAEGEDGTRYEVYLQPGEMVLYEGARIFHGRTRISQCNEMANFFSHFRPVGHPARAAARVAAGRKARAEL
jgi:hypothetical protein